ncbi:MAG: hypothetical protein HYY16_19735 [Planctomycetes bacterium]|nr:hypothetical protein [Planctomycetota bacterium]
MRISILCALGIAGLGCSRVPIEYGAATLDMTVADFRLKVPDAQLVEHPKSTSSLARYQRTPGEGILRESYLFHEDRLKAVVVAFDPSKDLAPLTRELEAKYGRPAQQASALIASSMVWEPRGAQILLLKASQPTRVALPMGANEDAAGPLLIISRK